VQQQHEFPWINVAHKLTISNGKAELLLMAIQHENKTIQRWQTQLQT
jgi:hypothetical protein